MAGPGGGEPGHEKKLIDGARRDALEGGSSVDLRLQSGGFGMPAGVLPGYRILDEVHRGGQGVVYRAVQQSTEREVAVKVLRDGPFGGARDRARFDREVRILALLDHPHIITVHESSSVDGYQYFVMNLVHGSDVIVYVRDHHLDTRGMITLFAKICHAVSAAHQRGVIHRDLKPSNILVDESGEPYILDFGLAKIAPEKAPGSSEWRMMTDTGQFVGTLPWASPEQVGGIPESVDVRSDVYSLGVVMFQALTGEFPYRVIGPAGEAITNIVSTPPTPLRRLRPELDDDVQTIVLKCLEKSPERRYQSAASLAEELDRYLGHQPILARPASALYQLRKLVSRHRVAAMLTISLIVATMGFGIWMSVLYRAADRARTEALSNLTRAMNAEQDATHAATRAERVSTFLARLFASSDPAQTSGENLSAEDILNRGAARIESELAGEPEMQAALWQIIGEVYHSLGSYASARSMFDKALDAQRAMHGDDHPDVVRALNGITGTLNRLRDYDASENSGREALSVARRLYAGDHADLAESLDNLGASLAGNDQLESEDHYREALAMRRRLFGNEHLDVAETLNHLALICAHTGKINEGKSMLQEAIAIYRKVYGENHPEVAHCLGTLARLLHFSGDLSGAADRLREAIVTTTNIYGEEHPNISFFNNALAVVLTDLKDFVEAEAAYRRALAMDRKLLGERHSGIATILANLARLLALQARYADAVPMYEEGLSIWENGGASRARVWKTKGELGSCYLHVNRQQDGERLLVDAFGGLSRELGEGHAEARKIAADLVTFYEASGRGTEADVWRDRSTGGKVEE